jgi:hypothetical protein
MWSIHVFLNHCYMLNYRAKDRRRVWAAFFWLSDECLRVRLRFQVVAFFHIKPCFDALVSTSIQVLKSTPIYFSTWIELETSVSKQGLFQLPILFYVATRCMCGRNKGI